MREFLLFIHFIGLGLGLGTSFSFMRMGMETKDMPMAEKVPFYLRLFALSKNGVLGFALLILSGIALIWVDGPAATFAAGGGFFIAKLCLVAVLIGTIAYLKTLQARAQREKGGPAMAKIPKVSPFSLLLTLAIVLLAVLAFH